MGRGLSARGHRLGASDLEWEVLVGLGNMIADGETGWEDESADVPYGTRDRGLRFLEEPDGPLKF